MSEMCYMCPQWNDWLGQCDASFWCPDKEEANAHLEQRKQDVSCD